MSSNSYPRGYFKPSGFDLVQNGSVYTYPLKSAAIIWANQYIDSNAFPLPIEIQEGTKYFGSFSFQSPTGASVELTNSCNANCVFCYRGSSPKKGIYLHKWRECFSSLEANGIHTVELTGGEPTYHPEFSEILDYCANRFPKIRLLTNGFLLNDMIPSLIRAAKKTDLLVQVDLDSAHENRHDKIKDLTGSHKKAIRTIELLSEARIISRVAMNVIDENMDEVDEVCELSERLGAQTFSASPILSVGRALSGACLSNSNYPVFALTMERLIHKHKGFIASTSEELPRDIWEKPKHCGAIKRTIAIDPKGNIRPCVMTDINRFVLGNIFTDKWHSIFTTDTAMVLSNIIPPSTAQCGDCSSIEFCWGCFTRPWHSRQSQCSFRETTLAALEKGRTDNPGD